MSYEKIGIYYIPVDPYLHSRFRLLGLGPLHRVIRKPKCAGENRVGGETVLVRVRQHRRLLEVLPRLRGRRRGYKTYI